MNLPCRMLKVTTERKVNGRDCAYVQFASYLIREDRLPGWVAYWHSLGCTYRIADDC